ncbi:uncharacterized protein LOC142233865 [Haematobia irritans]|uniref:uncharacterized protein LOC142233865 n=1 Tax=Haematobia irritans TaxID=7368 RepID=UPI003F4FB89C
MANLLKISLILLVVAIVACSAEAPRYRQGGKLQQQKRRLQPLRLQPRHKLARQELDEAVTPYPTAEELKPEVVFEEGNKPDEIYGPPDAVYGPPETEAAPSTTDQLPSEEAPGEFGPHPDAEEFQPSEVEAEQPSRLTSRRNKIKNGKITSSSSSSSSRLIQKKKSPKSQRLVTAPIIAAPAAPAVPISAIPFTASFPTTSQQYFVVNQPFSYSAQYQIW